MQIGDLEGLEFPDLKLKIILLYLIFCKLYSEQYVRSATNFKNRFKIHTCTKKDRCHTEQYFNNKMLRCCDLYDPRKYFVMQITEAIRVNDNEDIDELLWHSEQNWQS